MLKCHCNVNTKSTNVVLYFFIIYVKLLSKNSALPPIVVNNLLTFDGFEIKQSLAILWRHKQLLTAYGK